MSDTLEIADLLHFAREMAFDAGRLLVDYLDRVNPREKGPSDLVTEADFASQRLVADAIAREFPDHTLLAEEEGVVGDPSKEYRWIVDPLDGTINYAHKLPFWCVSIGLEHRGDPIVGVIHDPVSERTFAAGKGLGATLNGDLISVGPATRLADCLISSGMPTQFAKDADRQTALFKKFSDGTHSIRRTGSTALNLAYVAAGTFGVFYATSIHPWDVAAGLLIVREAGGMVTRLNGDPYSFEKPGILATNGRVHDESVAAAVSAWPAIRET